MTKPLTIRRIVVPVDDADRRYVAISIARDLAKRLSASVDRVTVHPTTGHRDDDATSTRWVDGISETRRTVAERTIDGALINEARTDGVILCVGSSGHVAAVETVTGSTWSSIVRGSPFPVVLVGPRCELHLRGSKIAIAVDGSPDGESIVEPALRLAEALALTPVLIQVAWAEPPNGTHGDVSDSSYVGPLAARMSRPGQSIQFDIFHAARPTVALRQLATSNEYALIAMSTHGLSPAERLLMPSRASRVLRHARCPVLLGRRSAVLTVEDDAGAPRVVVGIDGSSGDREVLAVAGDEADRRHASLEVMYAWTPAWFAEDGGIAYKSRAEVADAQSVIDHAVAVVSDLYPDLVVTSSLVERPADDALLDAASTAEVVVVGQDHRGLLERAIFGSTTAAVVRRSFAPVIVVPTRVG